MAESILFHNASLEDLKDLINKDRRSTLEYFKKEFYTKEIEDDLMTRAQVLEYLQIDPSTLWHWQNKQKIIVYKFANKNYYKRSEILESLKPLKK